MLKERPTSRHEIHLSGAAILCNSVQLRPHPQAASLIALSTEDGEGGKWSKASKQNKMKGVLKTPLTIAILNEEELKRFC